MYIPDLGVLRPVLMQRDKDALARHGTSRMIGTSLEVLVF